MLPTLLFKPTIYILLCILFFTFNNAKIQYLKKSNCSFILNKTVLKLFEHFCQNSTIHLIVLNEKRTSCEFDISKEEIFGRWQVVNSQPHNEQLGKDILECKIDAFVIFIYNFLTTAQLTEAISYLKMYSKSWTVHAKFLIVGTNFQYSKELKNKLVIDVLNFMWTRNAFRTALLIKENKENTASLFSSAPFSNLYSPCKEVRSITQVQEINITSFYNRNVSSEGIVGYTFRTPKSFSGCDVVGHTYPFPPYTVEESYLNRTIYNTGTEIKLLKLIAETYNLSFVISNTPGYNDFNGWTTRLPNGSQIGMFEDLKLYKIDLAFAGAIPISNNYYQFDSLNTFASSSISWYVADPETTPNWVYVLHTFTGSTWLSLASIFLLVALLYFLICTRLPNVYNEPVDLNMVGLSLGITLRWTKVSHLRILLFTWSLFSLHVTLMFNTKLFSVLAQHPENPGIRSIEDLYNSELRTCVSTFYRNFYFKQTDGMIKSLLENYVVCNDMNNAVVEFLQNRNFSILGKDDNMEFLVNRKRERIHRIDEKFITFPVSMYLKKGSVFKEPLIYLIFKTTESGLVQKWLRDIRKTVKVKHSTTGNDQQQKLLLSNEDFIWVYFVFLTGQVIALIILLLEICLSKI